MERVIGDCMCCMTKGVPVRTLALLYFFGDAGLTVCESCDSGIAEAAKQYVRVRQADRRNSDYKQALSVSGALALPRVTLGGIEYFIDNRLEQVRAADNPSNFMMFTDMSTEDLEACSRAFIAHRDAAMSSSIPQESIDDV